MNWFFWYSICKHFVDFCRACEVYKKSDLKLKSKSELQSIPISTLVMKQIGIDLLNLPEMDGFCGLLVCIDYFSKYCDAKPIMDKKATTILQFLYELMRRNDCFSVKINDQGRDFVNEITKKLQHLTGDDQRIASAYYP